jgi:F-type H+-transporting ATPase subunit epsilon
MSKGPISVQIYAPNQPVIQTDALFVRLPGRSGDIGVEANHTASLVECHFGEVCLQNSNGDSYYYMGDAIATIENDTVVIIASLVEPGESIDRKRAEAARERAIDRIRLSKRDSSIDTARAQAALRRAELRVSIAHKCPLS